LVYGFARSGISGRSGDRAGGVFDAAPENRPAGVNDFEGLPLDLEMSGGIRRLNRLFPGSRSAQDGKDKKNGRDEQDRVWLSQWLYVSFLWIARSRALPPDHRDLIRE
jgi:hypothetical protein